MSTRYLIAALLMASACAAQADVLPATDSTAQSGLLSDWTSGNGTDVVASGVLSSNVSLIGGVAYGSDASLAQALFQKASASVDQAGGQVKLSYAQGISGTYLLGTGHGVLAAMLGNGVSVIGSHDGVVVTAGTLAAADTVAGTPAADVVAALDTPISTVTLEAAAADVGDVPEPSSIALMMAGMLGALGISRRRKR
jgi:hypothetical protein